MTKENNLNGLWPGSPLCSKEMEAELLAGMAWRISEKNPYFKAKLVSLFIKELEKAYQDSRIDPDGGDV